VASEIEQARRDLPERIYQQEHLAMFLDDAGGVFRRVMEAATAIEQGPQPGHEYVFGVDWGKQNDFTVIQVFDITERRQVYMDRFNQIDYRVQRQRLGVLYERYNPRVIVAETNSMGEPIIEQLWADGLPVQGFTTTNATKAQIIDSLSLAFERGEITILNEPTLVGELQAYEMQRLPSGMARYSAPEGMHDDCVMALALAWQAVGRSPNEQELLDAVRAFR
jgi:phage FluMu gp28-like protein